MVQYAKALGSLSLPMFPQLVLFRHHWLLRHQGCFHLLRAESSEYGYQYHLLLKFALHLQSLLLLHLKEW
jgi:hypothetical protein